jgi:hypothetical protein
MMKKHLIFLTLLIVLLFVSACSTQTAKPADKSTQNGAASKNELTDLNRDKFNSYTSNLMLQFDGSGGWKYQLQTRKSPALREMNLHIEGLDKSLNPGDIRIVTDGKTTWMIGPGTDGECVQFPNNQGMDPTLLYPELLVPAENLATLLPYTGEDITGGIASLHYSGKKLSFGDWEDAKVDVWQDKTSRGLLRFEMKAFGADPYFGKGGGNLSATYTAGALDVAEIEAVKGCEITVSLPDSASNFVRLPGLASFETSAGVDEMRAYFQAQLPKENWMEKEAPGQTDSATVLSYQRNNESVEIQIEARSAGGSKVKIIFLQE